MSDTIIIPISSTILGFGESFSWLMKVIQMTDMSKYQDIFWDFNNVSLLNPFQLLPLSIYKHNSTKNITIINNRVVEYLNTINFDGGLEPDKQADGFHYIQGVIKDRTYLPIINFPSDSLEFKTRNEIISLIDALLKVRLNISGNLGSALTYFLDELINNITEHSGCERGYVLVQFYPSKNYLDLCIADSGRTIYGSFLNNNIAIEDELSALRGACNGKSTKDRSIHRGFGITTSRKMLVEGLGGNFFLFSGNAINVWTLESGDVFTSLPENVRWNGTIVALRIPYVPNDSFDFYKYVE